MGLDAFVYCRCWQDDLTTPCPIGPVGYDEDGWLALLRTGEYDGVADNAFYSWMSGDACAHRHMALVSEGVSNWAGVRLFQQALRAAGEHRFPTLAAALPDANGGSLPADRAAAVLAELDAFAGTARISDEVELIDEATGRVLMQYVESYRGVFMFGPGFQAGVDPDGFFVLDRADPPVTLFRAVRFGQRPVGEHGEPPPERLAVRTCSRSSGDFAYIVEPLRRLCAASVTTGNPVMWC
ncbi:MULTISPECIES: hypothetical protein [unclassified Micromonospora]|uniref:hypothetical protein n=1 Tax=unclassified Micromonospora TaxID=2617518 RepID=UPI001C213C30|nr:MULTISPECIES: hypothetical protein [unclassified Micromonospora]MBU8855984.1 hypothetical protein [Micromonospora sp. WMMB482]MDM4781590.1 hypothetical protein [Micromonospora sp. b486]